MTDFRREIHSINPAGFSQTYHGYICSILVASSCGMLNLICHLLVLKHRPVAESLSFAFVVMMLKLKFVISFFVTSTKALLAMSDCLILYSPGAPSQGGEELDPAP